MIVYFSGTGNSRYCAQMLASKLEEELTDSFYYIKNQISAELISGTPWVFISPTYCWQLPHAVARRKRLSMESVAKGNLDISVMSIKSKEVAELPLLLSNSKLKSPGTKPGHIY